jgi:4-amino-4-deoxy-L-arabinose transferase-like glycosyltransferase
MEVRGKSLLSRDLEAPIARATLAAGGAADSKDTPRNPDLSLRLGVVLAATVFLCGVAVRAGLAYASRGYLSHDDLLSIFEGQASQSQMLDFDTMPPLHASILFAWSKLFGIGVLQARLLSVVFSVLALAVICRMASYLFNRRVALLSLLLLSVSQASIFFGQMIRAYAIFQFLALLSSYLFIRALREKRLPLWTAFVISSIFMEYTHYYGVFVIAALVVCAFIYRKRYPIPRSWIVGGAAVALVSYLPWLVELRPGGPTDLRRYYAETSGLASYFVVHWTTFFKTLDEFNNGVSFRWWTLAAGGLLLSLPAALAMGRAFSRGASDEGPQRRNAEGATILAVLWLFPFLVLLGLGVLGVPFTLRYVLFCAAPYYILVAFGISTLKIAPLRLSLIALIVAYSGYSIADTFSQRSDSAHVVMAHIHANLRTGDCGSIVWIMTAPPSWLALWDTPAPGPPLAPIPIARADRLSARIIPRSSLPAEVTSCSRLWIIKAGEEDFGPIPEQMKRLDQEEMQMLGPSHSMVDEFVDHELAVDLYARNGD